MQFLDNHIDSARNYFVEALAKRYDTAEAAQMFRIVLAHMVGLEFSKTLPALSKHIRFSESEILTLLAIIKRLKLGEPLQYVLNEAWFRDYVFTVNKAVLIPRQETEQLVEETINWLSQNVWATKVLDIGTGSGCIPISIAKEKEGLDVYAIDYSKEALQVAAANAKDLQTQINFEHSDALTQNPFNGLIFDVIVSNPPYICEVEKKNMHENVLDFEPDMALFVPDNTPLLFYKKLAKIASKQLNKGGLVMVEINEHYGPETLALFTNECFDNAAIIKDLSSKDRFVKAIKA